MAIVVAFPIPTAIEAELSKHGEVRIWREEGPMPKATLLEWLEGARGLLTTLTNPVDLDILEAAPLLKVISTVSVGVDHIDVEAAASRGITVGHTPGVLTDSTADLALGLMLAVRRRIAEGHELVSGGAWGSEWKTNFMLGQDLSHATVGLIGLGPIAQAVASRLKAFSGVRILGWNRTPKELPDIEMMPLDALIADSDIVSLHVALTDDTAGLMSRSRLAAMHDGATLINTARGRLVDELALSEELASGRLSAGLDVYSEEPLPSNHPLIGVPNAVLVPHLGSATKRTRRAMFELAIRNLIAGIKERDLPAELVLRSS
tara:strand:+ start:866 stop:1822 length:957 start_codon:yes stop_codon:yes gene_type:complete